jgi:hypothetical protein
MSNYRLGTIIDIIGLNLHDMIIGSTYLTINVYKSDKADNGNIKTIRKSLI